MKPVIRAIAFDLDDTLLRDDRTISDETVSVLRRASEAGIFILPASGRTYSVSYTHLTLPTILRV